MRDLIDIVTEASNHWGSGPAAEFLEYYLIWEKEFGLEDKGFIIDFEHDKDTDDEVYIDMLWVPEDQRSEGWGRRIIGELKALADRTGITLTLVPLWQDDEVEEPFNLSLWYQNQGFLPRAGVLAYQGKK